MDFNGKTTTYAYDTNNRLLSKTPDPSFSAQPVSFTYYNNGLRKTMADPSGTTSYVYDNRNRLQTKQTPEGTLNYTYDNAGDLLTLASGNANGASDTYTYDALNRLSTVVDSSGTTTYAYDNVGNLQSFAYPNGVTTAYTYDTLNRLKQMGAGKNGTLQANYVYTLGAAGNRLTVAELSGRTVNYGYDSLYRLTSEAIANDPNNHNNTTQYQYDNVGNRQQLIVNGTTANAYSYDADDRLGSDQYDPNGNTISSAGTTSTYDFENHLVSKGGVTIVYDGDGNRVSETVAGVTTQYLVDTQNPTGYAQVVDELQSGAVTRTYSYGLERISETQPINSTLATSFYGYDGHGSVRFLTDATGNVTDTYDYDAFGNLISSTGSTPNNYLFAGEQYDLALGLYYNRARYLSTASGRFWSMDTTEVVSTDPGTLHRYLYVASDPINGVDPTGFYTQQFGYAVEKVIDEAYVSDFGDSPLLTFGKWSRVGVPSRSAPYALKPDIFDRRDFRGDGSLGRIWMEIKPLSLSGVAAAGFAWALYNGAFSPTYSPDTHWLQGGRIFPVQGNSTLVFNVGGILFYTTSQQDYKRLQDAANAVAGAAGAAAIGVAGGLLANLIAKLPQVPTSPAAASEVIDISTKARFVTTAAPAAEEEEVGLDIAVGL